MKSFKLDEMTRGWFVGDFEPAALRSSACEVAVRSYKAGDFEGRHVHKVATEVTLVLSGTVRMYGQEWHAGDIVVLAPGDAMDFEAVTDAVNIVVKLPSVAGDKYLL